MAALTEQIPAVITYLVTAAQTSPALGGATPPVAVIDGQPATQDVLALSPGGLTLRLWVGSAGYNETGLDSAATAAQGFSFIDQARTRDDSIDVACAAEAISGDTSMAAARAGAFAVMGAVELLLRGSPGTTPASPGDATMGGLVYWSEVKPSELWQEQSSQGAIALVRFRVTAFTRLTS
jgi:hypothetical protein